MKLICDLYVNNLEYAGLSGGKNRPKKCQISIVKNESCELAAVVQSPDNKHGTRYKLTKNVAQTFEKFISEGKCTIRLKKPSADLILSKCDIVQLKLFLKTIRSGEIASTNETKSEKNDNGKRMLQSLPSSQKKLKVSNFNANCRTKLTILSRKELVTTSFSQTLVELKLPNLDLTVIAPSISRLAKLQILDLSGNKLRELPQTFSGKLVELNLNNNLYHQAMNKTWRFFLLPNVRNFLQNLNLGNNEIPAVPLSILGLERLTTLNLADNKLRKFASSFGDYKRLRNLDVSNNEIAALDVSFQMLRLAHLDVTKAFTNEVNMNQGSLIDGVPSLKRIASALVRNKRICHRILPTTVQEDLLVMRRCRCYKVVAHTKEHFHDYPINNLAQTFVSDGVKYVKMHSSLCRDCAKSIK